MSHPELVYQTTSERVLGWWNTVEEQTRQTTAARDAYCEQLVRDFGPVGLRYEYDEKPIAGRPLMRNTHNEVTGVLSRTGEEPPKGSGWRLDANAGFWKPDLRSKAGKARAEELERLVGPDVLDALDALGARSLIVTMNRMYRPVLRFRPETGALYLLWASQDCQKEMEQAAVADITWARVPLSEWHAWAEQVEASSRQAAA